MSHSVMNPSVTLGQGDDQAAARLHEVLDGYLFGAMVET